MVSFVKVCVIWRWKCTYTHTSGEENRTKFPFHRFIFLHVAAFLLFLEHFEQRFRSLGILLCEITLFILLVFFFLFFVSVTFFYFALTNIMICEQIIIVGENWLKKNKRKKNCENVFTFFSSWLVALAFLILFGMLQFHVRRLCHGLYFIIGAVNSSWERLSHETWNASWTIRISTFIFYLFSFRKTDSHGIPNFA